MTDGDTGVIEEDYGPPPFAVEAPEGFDPGLVMPESRILAHLKKYAPKWCTPHLIGQEEALEMVVVFHCLFILVEAGTVVFKKDEEYNSLWFRPNDGILREILCSFCDEHADVNEAVQLGIQVEGKGFEVRLVKCCSEHTQKMLSSDFVGVPIR